LTEPLPAVDLAPPGDERYLRQVLLFGPEGQERLSRAIAAVGGGSLAQVVATRYAEGAGMRVVPGEVEHEDESIVTDPAARAVLAGARAALRAIVQAEAAR
jgi:hypothetical protein